MKSKFILSLAALCCLLFQHSAHAQWQCGFDPILQNEIKDHPEIKKNIDRADAAWSAYAQAMQQTGKRMTIVGGDTIYEIPVVIHVLHTGGAIGTKYNPSDNTLEDWIDYLNQVYAANYSGYPQAGSGGNSLPVKFVLAKRDPNCNATNGIERINMSGNSKYVSRGMRVNSFNGLTLNQVTAISQWPTNTYYNLYVINKFDGEDGNCLFCSYVAGFAMLGTTSPLSPYDGAYMLAKTAQAGDITLPHEVGHALGLYHVFEGGSQTACPPNNNCNTQNDKVCDTDPSRELLGSCPSASANNPCTSMSYGTNGVQRNIMNYTQCPNHFTAGQAERMMFMLQTYRNELINSMGAVAPGSVSPIAADCVPPGRTHAVNSNKKITVSFDSIQHSYGLKHYYSDFTEKCFLPMHTTLIAGDTYLLAITVPAIPNFSGKAYIDYNNDGSFSGADETVMDLYNNTGVGTTVSVPVVPPSTAATDTPLRMRVILDYNNANITPCGTLNYGKAGDFSVTIVSGTSTKNETSIYSKANKPGFGSVVNQQVKFFPNPVSEQLTIQSVQAMALVKVFDRNGRVILEVKKHQGNSYVQQINLSQLSSGMYLIQVIKTDGSMVTQKITKL